LVLVQVKVSSTNAFAEARKAALPASKKKKGVRESEDRQ
jgi:hypothetical protein